ncbi:MAG: nucleoside recognition domain-containing protein [Haloarculaceae archaeon]
MDGGSLALLGDVLVRVAWIAVFLTLGVGLANIAVAFGVLDRVGALAGPLTRPANLPREVGTAILATTASPTAGYGMLAEFRDSGVLDDRATLVAVTINTFFGFAQHIFTFYAPVLVPILGLEVGLLYVGARAAIALGISLVGILAGALLLSGENVDRDSGFDPAGDGETAPDGDPTQVADGGATTARGKLRAAAGETVTKLREILPRLLVIYTVVAVVVARYDVTAVTSVADPLAGLVGLPGAAVPTVAVFAIDTTNGAVFITPLVENGTFTPREAVATMLVGGIVSFAVSTFKRSIPFQFGVWGPEFGAKVVLVNTVLKVAFIAAAVAALLVL